MPTLPTILITGATDGIGQLAALALARRGARLVLTARSQVKADRTRAAILAVAPATPVDVHYVDFSDLSAVAATGKAIARQHPRIDVLINNAGLHAFRQRVSTDGYAEMIAVNYFAPWLLTHVLQESLLHSAPSRIVTVGSEASRHSGALAIERDLLDTAPFGVRGSSRIYGRSKLLDIMFSLELARRLRGSGVTVNCLCPGFNVTGLGRELGFARPLARLLRWFDIGNPRHGADGIVRLAVDPVFGRQTGAYVSAKHARALTPWGPGNSDAARRQLWDATANLLARFVASAPAH
ncbi:SDR family NAD(P)-dependent oxidoreductase [Xanthomonas bonasiae]|jgi:NAD(P)-dependent dehydrogenase (short-subunit alcohol dehydrogenase family)|uniref:SDR family NAD(P)-dependent oxidoreductase n=1 Tax=Xanthomonas bonasiae TaxID=2810351 RepID=UPI0017829C94|nr:SDR family NAD(P)-dependent oxidoreductase [Xanthomonas surreyensis]MBD7921764.1 SDR family NAD(P)-dependent oxidoreductase [Xanthomonas surreyensis]